MPDAFDVAWRGIKQFDGATLRLEQSVKRAGLAAGQAAGAVLATAAAAESPKLTGRLASSEQVLTRTFGGVPQTLVGPTAPYARRVDLGFKGKTRKGKQRRHGIYVDGSRVGWSTRGLQPTRANNYFGRAYDKSLPAMEQVYRRAWQIAIVKA